MRLDVFLKEARFIKRRTQARQACDAGHVKVHGATAKAGREVRPGDEIELTLPRRKVLLKVLRVPEGRGPRAAVGDLYMVLRDERTMREEAWERRGAAEG